MNVRSSLVRTGLRAGAVSTTRVTELNRGWRLLGTSPGQAAAPGDLQDEPGDVQGGWRDAVVPGTVAVAIGPDSRDPHPRSADALDAHENYDAFDWWYRCTFEGPARSPASDERIRLRFDGLATLAEVWLNGEPVLESANMFGAYTVDVTDLMEADNELVIAFRSLEAALAERRPRPRWKTKLVDQQQLRWFRTTLLGRIPGWTPAIEPVGPWRGVWLEVVEGPRLEALDLRATVEDGQGVARLDAEVRLPDEHDELSSAWLQVGADRFDLEVETDGQLARVRGEARIDEPSLWWPRTHGEPILYDCALALETTDGAVTVDCGRVGFRSVAVDRTDGAIRFVVNGVPLFCRGACWTSNDIVSLVGRTEDMRRTLELAADAHANMIRVGGTMVYESDELYDACDELGLMVWQDFMFANMDYPVSNAAFRAEVEAEAEQQLLRLQRHPSVVAYCGGSEVEQQAAMFGAPKELWTNDWFSETLPGLVSALGGDAPYWTSTPTGGALPFHVGEGLAHYFGVGAYLRPLEDVRTSGVRFTPECLGFSNVPEPENLRRLSATGPVPPHDPSWKRGVPRDSGAGWDFEDVRDHYLRLVHDVDPVALRSREPERYLALSRVVTGRVMAHVFDEWRSAESTCGGGLIWFLKDLRPGAGWGIMDSDNRPKAAYYYLKRAWAPLRVRLLDRGLDGVRLEVDNETAAAVGGELEVLTVGRGSIVTARTGRTISVAPGGVWSISVEEMLERFVDATYSYRFGPRAHEAVVARFHPSDHAGAPPPAAVRWSAPADILSAASVDACVDMNGRSAAVRLEAAGLLREVRLDCAGWAPEDNYFDMAAGEVRTLGLHATSSDPPAALRGFLEAANLTRPVRLGASA